MVQPSLPSTEQHQCWQEGAITVTQAPGRVAQGQKNTRNNDSLCHCLKKHLSSGLSWALGKTPLRQADATACPCLATLRAWALEGKARSGAEGSRRTKWRHSGHGGAGNELAAGQGLYFFLSLEQGWLQPPYVTTIAHGAGFLLQCMRRVM